MTEKIAASAAKNNFSEIINRVCFGHSLFIIERKGKPVAALMNIKTLRDFESSQKAAPPGGLLAAVGAWKEFKNMEEVISHIYAHRAKAKDRAVHLA